MNFTRSCMRARSCLPAIDRSASECIVCAVRIVPCAAIEICVSLFLSFFHSPSSHVGHDLRAPLFLRDLCTFRMLTDCRPPARLAACPLSSPEEPFFTARADVLMPYFFASGREGLAPMRSKVRSLAPCFSFYPSEEEEAGIKIFCASSFLPLFSSSHLLGRVSPRPPSRRIRMRMPNARTRIHFSCANPKTLHRSTRNGGGGA